MKLLKSAGLPDEFDGEDGYTAEIEDDPQVFYEAFVFTTSLGFDLATTTLELLLVNHYGSPRKTDSGTDSSIRSCALVYSAGTQTVTAQITDFGDHCGGYIHSKALWSWAVA